MRHDEEAWKRILQDAIQWGVTEACRFHRVHRSTLYRRMANSAQRSSNSDSRRNLEATILGLSKERPAWGCDRIAYFLGLEGIRISSPTVQKILIRHGLGCRRSRETQSEPPPASMDPRKF
ncbi:MAG TPA: hypothetical protein PKO15_10030 [Fibrobacteria bacterium]|nr:hypothetical protein [Fibrobacteria bacterium]HOX51769.1 hypothetical protein [Fibrobacteria bacterium]